MSGAGSAPSTGIYGLLAIVALAGPPDGMIGRLTKVKQ
jgi:hypothetical protein